MADKLADLSPEDKEKRIAEMKAKMQAAAAKSKTAGGEPAKAPAPAVKTAGSTAAPSAGAAAATVAAAPAVAAPKVVEEVTSTATNGASSNGASNGAAVAAAPLLTAPPLVYVEETAEQKATKEMNRREFLTYAWGAALGLLVLESLGATFLFMYPRFKAGEFGGTFFIGPEAALPASVSRTCGPVAPMPVSTASCRWCTSIPPCSGTPTPGSVAPTPTCRATSRCNGPWEYPKPFTAAPAPRRVAVLRCGLSPARADDPQGPGASAVGFGLSAGRGRAGSGSV